LGINADFGIAPSSGAKDDRASVIAALMDSTAPATRMTPDAMANWRDMLSDLNQLLGSHARGEDTTDQFACANVPPKGYNKSRVCDRRIDALLAANGTPEGLYGRRKMTASSAWDLSAVSPPELDD